MVLQIWFTPILNRAKYISFALSLTFDTDY